MRINLTTQYESWFSTVSQKEGLSNPVVNSSTYKDAPVVQIQYETRGYYTLDLTGKTTEKVIPGFFISQCNCNDSGPRRMMKSNFEGFDQWRNKRGVICL